MHPDRLCAVLAQNTLHALLSSSFSNANPQYQPALIDKRLKFLRFLLAQMPGEQSHRTAARRRGNQHRKRTADATIASAPAVAAIEANRPATTDTAPVASSRAM